MRQTGLLFLYWAEGGAIAEPVCRPDDVSGRNKGEGHLSCFSAISFTFKFHVDALLITGIKHG